MAQQREYDVSPIAWEAYKILYQDNFDNPDIIYAKGRAHLSSTFRFNGKVSDIMKFSGETDFNFKAGFSHTRIPAYKKYLQDTDTHTEQYEHRVSKCEELMYSVVNISIMPMSGNLQATKGKLANDRIDTFIYVLDNYYKGTDNLIMNYSSYENASSLDNFLQLFKNVYEYCDAIYHINEELVNKLIDSGKRALDTPQHVIQYIDLAYEFWGQKLAYFDRNSSLSDEMRNELERIRTMYTDNNVADNEQK